MPTNQDIIGEVVSRRTRNAKHWRLWDGSFKAEIYGYDIHFEDEAGTLQNINTDLQDEADFDVIDVPISKHKAADFKSRKEKLKETKKAKTIDRSLYDFHALQTPFDAVIPRNIRRGYSIGRGADNLRFNPVGASPAIGHLELDNRAKIVYQDVWNDADVHLEVLTNGLKETIILKSDRAPASFSFEVTGNLADDLTAGELKLQPAWLQDAAGTRRDVAQTVRRDTTTGKVFVDLAADVTGLLYPVEIDPTVMVKMTQVGAYGDATVVSSSPDTISYTAAQIYAGTSNPATIIQRALLKFDISTIPAGSIISSAALNLYFAGESQSTTPSVSVYRNTADFTPSTVTWNNKPTTNATAESTTTISNTSSDKQFTWNVLSALTYWKTSGNPNYGFTLINSDETSVGSYKSFRSFDNITNAPELQVVYNQAPSAPTVTAPNGGETWNSQQTITWNPATDGTSTSTYVTTANTDQRAQTSNPVGQTFKISNTSKITKIRMKLDGLENSRVMRVLNVVNGYGGGTVYATSPSLNTDASGYLTWDTSALNLSFAFGTMIAVEIQNGTGGHFITGYGANVYADGNSYVSASVGSDDYWLEITHTDSGTAQGSLQYQIQLSTDNKATWKDIVALTAAGATSYTYDFINEAQSSTCWIRIRAYDGTNYGPWDESNGVFTIMHNQAPTAPTNLAPASGAIIDRAPAQRLSWTHNDPNGDPQSKFDLQWRKQGDTVWNIVTVTTPNQYWDAPANTFPHGNIEWQVRTYDQAGLVGPYSAQGVFLAGDKPANPTITDPANNSTVAIARPVIQWSSSGQTSYQLQVIDSTGAAVWDPGEKVSGNKAETVGVDLTNSSTYTIKLRIKNADGLWSDWVSNAITVSYTPPVTPTITVTPNNGFVSIVVNNPDASGTQPFVSLNDVYRREPGLTDWIRIAAGIPTDGAYSDYAVASGKTYEYYVRALGDNGTVADSASASATITLTGVWLHDVADPAGTVYNFQWDGGGRSATKKREGALMKYEGRELPVAEFGMMSEAGATVQLQLLKDDPDYSELQYLINRYGTLCYRDGRGRKIFGVVFELPETDEMWGYTTSIRVDATSYYEEV